jgi:hypothetical protein
MPFLFYIFNIYGMIINLGARSKSIGQRQVFRPRRRPSRNSHARSGTARRGAQKRPAVARISGYGGDG